MSFKDEPPAELPGGGLREGPSGRAVTECVQERGELWVLPVIPAGWRVGAAAGRAAGGWLALPRSPAAACLNGECCCG